MRADLCRCGLHAIVMIDSSMYVNYKTQYKLIKYLLRPQSHVGSTGAGVKVKIIQSPPPPRAPLRYH